MNPRELRASGQYNRDIRKDLRSEFARDVDRFYYNDYWLRLAEITQVYSAGTLLDRLSESQRQHNRMTHSQKVAQVGRRLTQYLLADDANATGIEAGGGLDLDVVEAACMAHDLGHPPFGHRGEQELDRLARLNGLSDGFEGNAQTFRILTVLSQHDPAAAPEAGMDLTAAILAASMKYPWARDRQPDSNGGASARWRKFGYYDVDLAAFKALVRPLLPESRRKTLEAQVMDLADDITYAAHDVEDFYKAGLIPLDRLRHRDTSSPGRAATYEPVSSPEVADFLTYAGHRLPDQPVTPEQSRNLFAEYASYFPELPYEGRRLQDGMINGFASKVITDSSKAASVAPDGTLYVVPRMRAGIAVLKQLTWHYVIERPDLVGLQAGQVRTLHVVFEHLLARARHALAEMAPDLLTGKVFNLSVADRWQRRRTLPTKLDEFLDQGGAQELHDEDRDRVVARATVDYVASMTEREVVRYAAMLGPTAVTESGQQ
jgi:dGTPase